MNSGTFNHHPNVPSQIIKPRRVDVWLPPGYENENGRFPVLYMHDGQNLFHPEHAYLGETWGIPAAMTKLIAAREVPPTIVVGIWNGGDNRWAEYMPERPLSTPEGQARLYNNRHNLNGPVISDNYLKFLVTELKPFIDKTYRTLPEREHTTIMGSSMGGLISLYALCEYPHIFRAAGCVSTHWPAGDGIMLDYMKTHLPKPGTHKIYFDYGTETLDAEYESFQLLANVLMRDAGYTQEKDWITRKFDGAAHNEPSWRKRVHIPLTFIL